MADVLIRNCTVTEMPLLFHLCSNDGRNPGLNDSDLFYRFDMNGFFIAINNNTLIGSISSIAYDETFGFIGMHLLLPEFQNTAVEEKLLEAAIQKLGKRNIGLNCYETQVDYYTQHGFKPAHNIFTYEGISERKTISMENIVSPFMHPLDLLLEIDKQSFPYNRKEFLPLWLQQSKSLLLAKLIDNKYTGYGLYLPCANGNKISPLVSIDPDTAEHLLTVLVHHMNEGVHFSLDIPDTNEQAILLAEKMNMKKIKTTVRMYLNGNPGLSLNNVYGFTNYEIG
jgi:predicted GNAT family N-acyltransferase